MEHRIKPDGRTTCCNAYTSISIDDGVEYCKACFEAIEFADACYVVGMDPFPAVMIVVPDLEGSFRRHFGDAAMARIPPTAKKE